jgi:tRNA pseudouridine32 synthase/23S rRNA pseudouridine746 synthase
LNVPQPPRAAPGCGFELVHIDDSLLVANKPAGLLAVPGRGPDKQDCLVARVQAAFPDALTVHRLDMATSGLILFARGAQMQGQLSRMFRERLIEKRYVALVAGKIAPEIGEIALPLIADWPNRPRQKVDHDIGKPSLTRYRLLDYDADCDTSYVELEPVTGRSHQLRVHLLSIGHAIVGDELYGGRLAERLMLHACLLSFVHPLTGQPLTLASDPPFRSLTDAILSPVLS